MYSLWLTVPVVVWLQTDPVSSFEEVEYIDCIKITPQGQEACDSDDYSWCKWNEEYSVCIPHNKNEEAEVDALDQTWDEFGMELNWFWMICIPAIYVTLFMISRIFCNYLIRKDIISASYYEKCLIYSFEILCSFPITFKLFYPVNIYDIVFFPKRYKEMEPQEYNDLFGSVMFVSVSIAFICMVEMVYITRMKTATKIHHWVSITTITLSIIAMTQRASLDLIRVLIALTLYPTTETHIFIQLLLYRIYPSRFVTLHYLSAYLFAMSRLFGFVIITFCYIQWCINWGFQIISNKDNMFLNSYAYMFSFFYIGFGSILLNLTQYAAIKSLFLVAERVYNHGTIRKQKQYHPRIDRLYEIYTSYDDSIILGGINKDEWNLEQFEEFVQDYCNFGIEKNPTVTKLLFDSLLLIQHWQNVGHPKHTNTTKQRSSNLKKLIMQRSSRRLGINQSPLKQIRNQSPRSGGSVESSSTGSIDRDEGKEDSQTTEGNRTEEGIKWKTFLYLFKTQLLYFSDKLDPKDIITKIMTLLVTGAHDIITRFPDNSELDNFDNGEDPRVERMAESIENITKKAQHSVIQLSGQYDKDVIMVRAQLGKPEKIIMKRNGCELCILFILRCVPCRYGCQKGIQRLEKEASKVLENEEYGGGSNESVSIGGVAAGGTGGTGGTGGGVKRVGSISVTAPQLRLQDSAFSKESLEMGLSINAMIGLDPFENEMRIQHVKRMNSRQRPVTPRTPVIDEGDEMNRNKSELDKAGGSEVDKEDTKENSEIEVNKDVKTRSIKMDVLDDSDEDIGAVEDDSDDMESSHSNESNESNHSGSNDSNGSNGSNDSNDSNGNEGLE